MKSDIDKAFDAEIKHAKEMQRTWATILWIFALGFPCSIILALLIGWALSASGR